VLIAGETGTGKELVARAVHGSSDRHAQAFVAVSCAGLSESLLESELFGHEKGAFTGADRSRQGVFEAAHRGTLFLDEAGEMSLALQAKLLRVLTTGEVVRVGSTVPRPVDVRIVAATNRDLEAEVEQGRFRQDLYYRLAVVPVTVPPLRERADDVPLLAEHFLEGAARELKTRRRVLSPEARQALLHYPFPGNVRELRNLMERATILARGEQIEREDLPLTAGAGPGAAPGSPLPAAPADPLAWADRLPPELDLRDLLERIERRLILRALEAAGGVQAEAARQLGLSRSHLAYKLRRLDL
jgi:transcriptional regulator with GAF, ATPase, and Fis domain